MYTVILILVLFFELVPTLVIGKIVDFFTTYTEGDSLNVFYSYVFFLTIAWGIVALIRLTVKKSLSNMIFKRLLR